MNEKELIKKAQSGDIAAFEQLVSEHTDYVFNIALGMLNNYHDAHDVSQDSFIKAFRAIKKFNLKSSFSTWIYRITMNTCLDHLRQKKRKTGNSISIDTYYETLPSDAESPLASPKNVLEQKETRKAVIDAINKLPDKYKKMIVLRDINGFPYDKIAAIEKCSLGTVKSRLSRARNQLKEILKDNEELFL